MPDIFTDELLSLGDTGDGRRPRQQYVDDWRQPSKLAPTMMAGSGNSGGGRAANDAREELEVEPELGSAPRIVLRNFIRKIYAFVSLPGAFVSEIMKWADRLPVFNPKTHIEPPNNDNFDEN